MFLLSKIVLYTLLCDSTGLLYLLEKYYMKHFSYQDNSALWTAQLHIHTDTMEADTFL